jgi:hypothetical protein
LLSISWVLKSAAVAALVVRARGAIKTEAIEVIFRLFFF